MTDLFIDSGAPTIYNKFIRKVTDNKYTFIVGNTFADRKDDDFSFVHTKEYLDYKHAYLEFLKANHKYFQVIINLDIINNPELTWENQQFYEKAGIPVLPVFHLGCDQKWLEMYIRKGYKYIALGGISPNPYSKIKDSVDEVWIKYFLDKKGYPKIKVHGLAITSPRFLYRWPFYSVDSTSWVKLGLFGSITVPKQKYGKLDYKSFPMVIFVSIRTSGAYRKNCRHIETMSKPEKRAVLNYIEERGFILGKSELKKEPLTYVVKKDEVLAKKHKDHKVIEVILERGISNDNIMRDTLNGVYYQELADSIPEWPWKVSFYKNKGLFS